MASRPDLTFDEAIESLGLDPSLSRAQLALTPAERIAESCERTRFHQRMQSRTLSFEALEALRCREIDDDLERLGPVERA